MSLKQMLACMMATLTIFNHTAPVFAAAEGPDDQTLPGEPEGIVSPETENKKQEQSVEVVTESSQIRAVEPTKEPTATEIPAEPVFVSVSSPTSYAVAGAEPLTYVLHIDGGAAPYTA